MTTNLKLSNLGSSQLGSSQLSKEELAHVKGGDFVTSALDFGKKALDIGNKVATKLPIKPSIGGGVATNLLRHAVFPPAANAPTLTDYNSGKRQ